MIAISNAICAADFDIAAAFCRALGEWDAIEAQAYGTPAALIIGMFHGDTSDSLAEKYSSAEAMMFLARWEGKPAGCLAFSPFDDTSTELHKFYVDPLYRGKGIGGALMRMAFVEMQKGHRRTVRLATTVYMTNAIAVYEAFSFARCPPYYAVPDSMSHTEIFMTRPL
jgi:GNAT superfamily N-acetyltransferase